MEISSYYQESVELGKQFQKLNKSWDGKDTFSYHRQIRDVVKFYDCKTVLDYGCGKGNQWIETVPFWPEVEPKSFKQYLGIDSVYQYDPCVEQFEQAPPNVKFDLVICNQVLPYIPDQDLVWLKQTLMQHTGKVCFIGMHSQPPQSQETNLQQNTFYYR